MKASDKICVAPHQIFDYDLDIQEVGHNGAEEYIRKDALLEWAEKCKKIIEGSLRVKYDESLAIRGLMYAIFMDKLNEM